MATLEWKFERGVGEHSCAKVQKDRKGVDQHSSAKIMEYMLVRSPSFYFGLFGEGVCWLILGGSIELGVGQLLYANFILYMLAPFILFLIGWPRTFVGHPGVEIRKGCWRTFMS